MKTENLTLLSGESVLVSEITYGEYKATRESSDDFDNDVALVSACTGLSAEALDDVDAPDFNELLDACVRLNDPEAPPAIGTDSVELSKPVMLITGEESDVVSISMPKVKHSRELAKLKDGFKRVEYMIQATTGIQDLEGMPMGDYAVLVVAVPDFFVKGAGYFQKFKSMNS